MSVALFFFFFFFAPFICIVNSSYRHATHAVQRKLISPLLSFSSSSSSTMLGHTTCVLHFFFFLSVLDGNVFFLLNFFPFVFVLGFLCLQREERNESRSCSFRVWLSFVYLKLFFLLCVGFRIAPWTNRLGGGRVANGCSERSSLPCQSVVCRVAEGRELFMPKVYVCVKGKKRNLLYNLFFPFFFFLQVVV